MISTLQIIAHITDILIQKYSICIFKQKITLTEEQDLRINNRYIYLDSNQLIVYNNMNYRCRPLIRPVQESENKFIDLPYKYSLQQIQQLILYLPSCLKFVGVDFEDEICAELKSFKKIRNGLIATKGKNTKDGGVIMFRSVQKYQWVSWNIDMVVEIYYEHLKTNTDLKGHLKNILTKMFYLINKEKDIMQQQSLLSCEEIKKCEVKISSSQIFPFRNEYFGINQSQPTRVFRGNIPSGILMCEGQCVSVDGLKGIITTDLSSVINILQNSDLAYRDIRLIEQSIPVHNFLKQKDSKDEIFQKFVSVFQPQKPLGIIPAQKSNASPPNNQPNNQKSERQNISSQKDQKKNNQNTSIYLLGCLLALVFLIYFYVKFRVNSGEQIEVEEVEAYKEVPL